MRSGKDTEEVETMKTIETSPTKNEYGAIGIGAMIVFIALILVAAVASAVIIQTGEKLQQNAQQAGSDTQQEISGKISIVTVWLGDQTASSERLIVVFELAPGSEPILNTNVHWSVICDAGGGTPAVHDGDFGQVSTPGPPAVVSDTAVVAQHLDRTAIANGIFLPGGTYIVELDVGDAVAADSCAPTIGEEHSMIITVNGGGTTYETLSYTSEDQGDIVV